MPRSIIPVLQALLRLLLSALFLAAGALHLRDPQLFLPIMPPWIPFPLACIIISGLFEIAGGIGLLIPVRVVQLTTGWMLLLLLLAVFPANIYMAAANIKIHGFPAHAWEAWARLPLQPLIMAAIVWVTRLWPASCK